MTPPLKALFEDKVIGPKLRLALDSEGWRNTSFGSSRDTIQEKLEVLKYRPERRLCLALPGAGGSANGSPPSGGFIIKIWYNRRGERIHQRLVALNESLSEHDGLPGPCIPKPTFYDPKAHTLVYPRIDGVPLTRWLKRGICRSWIRPLVDSLAALHGSKVGELPPRTAHDELKSVHVRYGKIGRGEGTETIERLMDRLEASVPAQNFDALLHRDLYDHQILFRDDGRVSFIDLDDMAEGDPMLDVGNLLAHVSLITHWRRRPEKLARLRKRLLEHYAKARDEHPADRSESAVWYEAVSLARLAVMQFQRGHGTRGKELASYGLRLLEPQDSNAERLIA